MCVRLTGRVSMLGRRLHVPNVGSQKVEIICFGSLNERRSFVLSELDGQTTYENWGIFFFFFAFFRCKFILNKFKMIPRNASDIIIFLWDKIPPAEHFDHIFTRYHFSRRYLLGKLYFQKETQTAQQIPYSDFFSCSRVGGLYTDFSILEAHNAAPTVFVYANAKDAKGTISRANAAAPKLYTAGEINGRQLVYCSV